MKLYDARHKFVKFYNDCSGIIFNVGYDAIKRTQKDYKSTKHIKS